MRKLFFLALAVVLISPTASLAMNIECELRNWKGATDDVTISWLGQSFIADFDRGTVQINTEGSRTLEEGKVVKSTNFTGIVFYESQRDDSGKKHNIRYSFRIYKSGKCEARLDQPRYTPLDATGRVRK